SCIRIGFNRAAATPIPPPCGPTSCATARSCGGSTAGPNRSSRAAPRPRPALDLARHRPKLPHMPRSWYGVPAWAALTALTIAGSVAAQGMSLTDAARLARARAERQRPAQEAALKPFLPELRLDYWRNQEVLDGTIEKVAALDGVVPLLLEYLTPADESRDARRLAANSARVL